VPARLATVLYNFQSYTAAPRQLDLDKLGELTGVARDASERGHFGLRVLGDMARAAGGRLDVTSEPGCGTRLSLEVPV